MATINEILENISINQDRNAFSLKSIPSRTNKLLSFKDDTVALKYINNNVDGSSWTNTVDIVDNTPAKLIENGLGKDFLWNKIKINNDYYYCLFENISIPDSSKDKLKSPKDFNDKFSSLAEGGVTSTSKQKAIPKTLTVSAVNANTYTQNVVYDIPAASYAAIVKTNIDSLSGLTDAEITDSFRDAYNLGVSKILNFLNRKLKTQEGIDLQYFYYLFSKIYDYYINSRQGIPINIVVSIPERYIVLTTEINIENQQTEATIDETIKEQYGDQANIESTSYGITDFLNKVQDKVNSYSFAAKLDDLLPGADAIISSVNDFDGDPDSLPFDESDEWGVGSFADLFGSPGVDVVYMSPEKIAKSSKVVSFENKNEISASFASLKDILVGTQDLLNKEKKANGDKDKNIYKINFRTYGDNVFNAYQALDKLTKDSKYTGASFKLVFTKGYPEGFFYKPKNSEKYIEVESSYNTLKDTPFTDITLCVLLANIKKYKDEKTTDAASIKKFLETYIYPEEKAVVINAAGSGEPSPNLKCLKDYTQIYEEQAKFRTQDFIRETNLRELRQNLKISISENEWKKTLTALDEQLKVSIGEYKDLKTIDWEYVISKGTECITSRELRETIRFILVMLKKYYVNNEPLLCNLPVYALPRFPSFRLPRIPKLQSFLTYFYNQVENEINNARNEAARSIVQSIFEIVQLCEVESNIDNSDNVGKTANDYLGRNDQPLLVSQTIEEDFENLHQGLVNEGIVDETDRFWTAEAKLLIDTVIPLLSRAEVVRLFLGIPSDVTLEVVKYQIMLLSDRIKIIYPQFTSDGTINGRPKFEDLIDTNVIDWFQKFGALLRPNVLDTLQLELSNDPALLCLPQDEIRKRMRDALRNKGLTDDQANEEITKREETIKEKTNNLAKSIQVLNLDAITPSTDCEGGMAAKFGRPLPHKAMTETTVTKLFEEFEKQYESDLGTWTVNSIEKDDATKDETFMASYIEIFDNITHESQIINSNKEKKITVSDKIPAITLKSTRYPSAAGGNPWGTIGSAYVSTSDEASWKTENIFKIENNNIIEVSSSQTGSKDFALTGPDLLAGFLNNDIVELREVRNNSNLKYTSLGSFVDKVKEVLFNITLEEYMKFGTRNFLGYQTDSNKWCRDILNYVKTRVGFPSDSGIYNQLYDRYLLFAIAETSLDLFPEILRNPTDNIQQLFETRDSILNLFLKITKNIDTGDTEQNIEYLKETAKSVIDLTGSSYPGFNYINYYDITLLQLQEYALRYALNLTIPTDKYNILTKNITVPSGSEISWGQEIGNISVEFVYPNSAQGKFTRTIPLYFPVLDTDKETAPWKDLYSSLTENYATAIAYQTYDANGNKSEVKSEDFTNASLKERETKYIYAGGNRIITQAPGPMFKAPRRKNLEAYISTLKVLDQFSKKPGSTNKFKESGSVAPPVQADLPKQIDDTGIIDQYYYEAIKDRFKNSTIFKSLDNVYAGYDLSKENGKKSFIRDLILNPPFKKCDNDKRFINILNDIKNGAIESSADMACYVPKIEDDGTRQEDSPSEAAYIYGVYQLLFRLFAVEFNLCLLPFKDVVRFMDNDTLINASYVLFEDRILDSSIFGETEINRKNFLDRMYLFLTRKYFRDNNVIDKDPYVEYTATDFREMLFKENFKDAHFLAVANMLYEMVYPIETSQYPSLANEKIRNAKSLEEYEFFKLLETIDNVNEDSPKLYDWAYYKTEILNSELKTSKCYLYGKEYDKAKDFIQNAKKDVVMKITYSKKLTVGGVSGIIDLGYPDAVFPSNERVRCDIRIPVEDYTLASSVQGINLKESLLSPADILSLEWTEDVSVTIFEENDYNLHTYRLMSPEKIKFLLSLDKPFAIQNVTYLFDKPTAQECKVTFREAINNNGQKFIDRYAEYKLELPDYNNFKAGNITGNSLIKIKNDFMLYHKYTFPLKEIYANILAAYLLSVYSIEKYASSFDSAKKELVDILLTIDMGRNYKIETPDDSILQEIANSLTVFGKMLPQIIESTTVVLDPNMMVAKAASNVYAAGMQKINDKLKALNTPGGEDPIPKVLLKQPAATFGIGLATFVPPLNPFLPGYSGIDPSVAPIGWAASIWNYTEWLLKSNKKNKC